MKLYLSSFRIGNQAEKLVGLFGENKRVVVIANAMDYLNDPMERKQRVQQSIDELTDLGLSAEEIDLREFFNKNELLADSLNKYSGVWVRGGNAFVLRRAMRQSGFDKFIIEKISDNNFIYGGYSAGVCVLTPDLHGTELVDDPSIIPDGYEKEIIWEGLKILDYYFAPHYRSDHPESPLVGKQVEYYKTNKMPYRALHDGEVIVSDERH